MSTEETEQKEVLTTFNGVEIWLDENRLVNLTQMHVAAGSPQNKDPREWRRKSGRQFVVDLAKSLNVVQSHIIQGRRGRNGATLAHWQIALSYAASLSTEFHRHINEVFREWKREDANPDLKVERAIEAYQKRGMSREQAEARVVGTATRKLFTSSLARHRCKVVPECNPYQEVTTILALHAVGETPAETRRKHNLGSGPTRDGYSLTQLQRMDTVEHLTASVLDREGASGNEECIRLAKRTGKAFGQLLTHLGLD